MARSLGSDVVVIATTRKRGNPSFPARFTREIHGIIDAVPGLTQSTLSGKPTEAAQKLDTDYGQVDISEAFRIRGFPCWQCFSDNFETGEQRNRHKRHGGCRPMCLNPSCHSFGQIPSTPDPCHCASTSWEQWIKLFKMRWPELMPPPSATASAVEQRRCLQTARPQRQPRVQRRHPASLPPVPLFSSTNHAAQLREQSNPLPAPGELFSDLFSSGDSTSDNACGGDLGSMTWPFDNFQGSMINSAIEESFPAASTTPSQLSGQNVWTEVSTESTGASSSPHAVPARDQELASLQREMMQLRQSLDKFARMQDCQPNDEQSPLEVVLGLVWQQLIDARVPAANRGTALYKQVKLIAPRVIADANYHSPTVPNYDAFGGILFDHGTS